MRFSSLSAADIYFGEDKMDEFYRSNAEVCQKSVRHSHHNATDREKCIYGNRVEIVSRDEGKTVYRLKEKDGEVVMTSYRVFDGIELVYNDVHTQSCVVERNEIGTVLQINHCREGRIECSFGENEFLYLGPGDMSVSCKNNAGHDSYFPTSHYHGITVMIDVEKAPECLSCFLEDVNVSPAALVRKFRGNNGFFIARSAESIEHIFSELYSVRDNIKKGYFKVKVLELLLFLSSTDVSETEEKSRRCTASQVLLAKKACAYISSKLDERITIEQLSEKFHVCPTQLKNCFKRVYGISVYAYIRTQKMLAAEQMLKTTDETVLSIANRFGYDNGSKFAKAFRDIVGVSPSDFRKNEAN